jgi:hypothetical protein
VIELPDAPPVSSPGDMLAVLIEGDGVACGMLAGGLVSTDARTAMQYALLWVRDRGANRRLRRLARLRERVVARVEELAVLCRAARFSRRSAPPKTACRRTFCIFEIMFLCVGSLPYRRKSFCSSSVSFCAGAQRSIYRERVRASA